MTGPSKKLVLPSSLQSQLREFKQHLWTVKTIEGASIALVVVLTAFLVLFVADRFADTPASFRGLLFAIGLIGVASIPIYLFRWVWSRRRLDQIARLLSRKHPSIGDQMLGIIELVRDEKEQARSQALCQAAILQVAQEAACRDFHDAVPHPRHRLFALTLAVPALLVIVAAVASPPAILNTSFRFIAPWAAIDRYTFTSVEPLPDRLIVPHGESFDLVVKLLPNSRWFPEQAKARLRTQPEVDSKRNGSQFGFSFPPQIVPTELFLQVGDVRQSIPIEPTHRPELTSVQALVSLPAYLGRQEKISKDARGGSIAILSGSAVQYEIHANREIASATLDGASLSVRGSSAVSEITILDASVKRSFEWTDRHGLTGLQPFTLSVDITADEPPTISCDDLPRQRIILDSDTLKFRARAQDDYGVKVVGMDWKGIDPSAVIDVAGGERILAGGNHEKESLEVAGTFCPKSLGISPQPIHLRLFVEDYRPDRARIYSNPYVFYILSPEQHAIWIAEQMSKWHRQSLEVRDRELQLHSANEQLRRLSPEELDRPETRRRIEAQASAERANGKQLSGLMNSGEELVREAMRNPEIGVGHLDRWAEMLQIMKDIAGNRMPTVADLLKESSSAPSQTSNDRNSSKPPTAGNTQASLSQPPDGGKETPNVEKEQPRIPRVVDTESSQAAIHPNDPADPSSSKKPSTSRLTLPVTTVVGDGGPKKPAEEETETEKLDQAVEAQKDLLAEFDKVSEELNRVLANLEGSTLTKRLKAASRQQYQIAGKVSDHVSATFGKMTGSMPAKDLEALQQISTLENASAEDVSRIVDDLEAYFERRRLQRFKTVLEELRTQDAVSSLRKLGEDIPNQTGMSIAQAEFWSDTFDRLADDLVDPACSGKCPGGKSKSSLPPSIVLEAMKILEAEMNLREETRVAEQARAVVPKDEYEKRGFALSKSQGELTERIGTLTNEIRALPDGEAEFSKEVQLLTAVEQVMQEATSILRQPDTGAPAIAAETEAIELLLRSKKINPKGGGGGGGDTPGGGGTGTTTDTALALIGTGINEKEVREDHTVTQSTGESGSTLPEEFRAGLDEYFNRLEREEKKQ